MGTVLVFGVAALIAFFNGGFSWPGELSLAPFQAWWLLIILAGVVAGLLLLLWRPNADFTANDPSQCFGLARSLSL